jgi:hypothetical protein
MLWNNAKVDYEKEFWTDRFTGITLRRLAPNNFSNPSMKQWDYLFTVRSSSYLRPRFTSGSTHFTRVCRFSNACYTSHSSHQNMGEKITHWESNEEDDGPYCGLNLEAFWINHLSKAKWTGHTLRRNYLLKQVTEKKNRTGRRARRRKQLLGDLK